VEWITIQDSGTFCGITTRRVQFLCAKGKVDRAQKLADIWVIPKGTQKPIDGRIKAAKGENYDTKRANCT